MSVRAEALGPPEPPGAPRMPLSFLFRPKILSSHSHSRSLFYIKGYRHRIAYVLWLCLPLKKKQAALPLPCPYLCAWTSSSPPPSPWAILDALSASSLATIAVMGVTPLPRKYSFESVMCQTLSAPKGGPEASKGMTLRRSSQNSGESYSCRTPDQNCCE